MHTEAATAEQLLRRGQLDMSCPAMQLRVYELDARTRVVDGCGRRVIYVASCEPSGGEVACTWIANSPYPSPYMAAYGYRAASPPPPSWGGGSAPAQPSAAAAQPSAVALQPASSLHAVPQPTPVPSTADDDEREVLPPGYARLHVASTGGFCRVLVNGVPRGHTPVGAIAVKAGTVELACRDPRGVTQRKKVMVRQGETARVRFSISSRR